MHEMEAQFGMIPGKPVPRVKASDIKAVWKLGRDTTARHPAGTQVAIGAGLVQHVCSPDADVMAVSWRGMRLGMLMAMCDKRDAQPPDILFTIYAKFPMKWWVPGEIHRGLF